jgi:hypothetical protein
MIEGGLLTDLVGIGGAVALYLIGKMTARRAIAG